MVLGIVRNYLKPGAGRLELLQGPWAQQRQALHRTSLKSDVYLCLPQTLYSFQEGDIAMPVYALLSTKRNGKKKKRGREQERGSFRKDCLEIEFVALSYAAGFLCSSLVSLFLLRGVVCGFNK